MDRMPRRKSSIGVLSPQLPFAIRAVLRSFAQKRGIAQTQGFSLQFQRPPVPAVDSMGQEGQDHRQPRYPGRKHVRKQIWQNIETPIQLRCRVNRVGVCTR